MARPITWYWINTGDLPIFTMPEVASYAISSENGSGPLSKGREITLPLFNLKGDLDSIHQGICNRVQNLLKPFRPSPSRVGYLFGAVRYFERFSRDPREPLQLQLGLIITQRPITPAFRDSNDAPGVIRLIEPSECLDMGLPLSDDSYIYTGPRPTRFEREWVI